MDIALTNIKKNPKYIHHLTKIEIFNDFNFIYHALKTNAESWKYMADKVKYHEDTLRIVAQLYPFLFRRLQSLPKYVTKNNILMVYIIQKEPQCINFIFKSNINLVKLFITSNYCNLIINCPKFFFNIPHQILNDTKLLSIIHKHVKPFQSTVHPLYHTNFARYLSDKFIINKNIIFAIYCKQTNEQQLLHIVKFIKNNILLIKFVHKKFSKDINFISWVLENFMTNHVIKMFALCVNQKIDPFIIKCDDDATLQEKKESWIFYFMIKFIHKSIKL